VPVLNRHPFAILLISKSGEYYKAPLKSPSANESRWGARGEDGVLHPAKAVALSNTSPAGTARRLKLPRPIYNLKKIIILQCIR